MPTSLLTALAVGAQIVAPTLSGPISAGPPPSPSFHVAETQAPTAGPRHPLAGQALTHAVAHLDAATTNQQTGSQPSKRGKMLTGALIGFAVGSVLGVTVGQESCLNQSKWVCVAKGGGFGAAIGALIALK